MSENPEPLIEQLEQICARIRALDLEANRLLHEERDREQYRRTLLEKAELLASLPEMTGDAAGLLARGKRAWYREAVYEIAEDAMQAMALDSVFYMSVLLLPGDARQSANDLEQLLARLQT